jgi:hypothetical protein
MEPSGSDRYIDSGNRESFDVVKLARMKKARLLAALAAGGLLLSPAFANSNAKKRPPAVALSADPVFSFTPANADPKLAAALQGKGLALTDFKFTPAPAKGRPSQIRVAVRAPATSSQRTLTDANAASPAVSSLAPVSYNLGVAVGWKRFGLAGDVSKTKDADIAQGGRESAVVGVSYSLTRFTGRVALGAERGDGRALPALRKDNKVSLDVGGSYSLSRRIALTGGVRYQIERDPMATIRDNRRDSQAVYVGTAFKF